MDIRKMQKVAVSALEDIKARDIEVFDVRHLTSLFDRVIIATAESARQTKALANNLREKLKAAGASIQGVEGEESGDWVLVDAGDIIVHIMQPATREFYNLEELWGAPAPRRRAARKRTAEAGASA
ncbi:MAG: ribosome silencing factor [Burkholderiales bacterium]|nr:ribosome silencing factor [Burkholderiales bacterium]